MRILPYRTVENVIEGVVLTFAEITSQKTVETGLRQLNEELRVARDFIQVIIDTLQEGVLILDDKLCIIYGNRSFYQQFQVTAEDIKGKYVFDLPQMNWDDADLKKPLEAVISQDHTVESYEFEHSLSDGSQRTVHLSFRPMPLSS